MKALVSFLPVYAVYAVYFKVLENTRVCRVYRECRNFPIIIHGHTRPIHALFTGLEHKLSLYYIYIYNYYTRYTRVYIDLCTTTLLYTPIEKIPVYAVYTVNCIKTK